MSDLTRATEEQQEALSAVGKPDSLMLKAYAGCGKSSTLEMMAQRIQKPGLALAFNRKIVEELKPRMPDNFTVKSLNGLGHGAWMRRPGMPRLQIDAQKSGKLITALAKESKVRLSTEQWDWIRQLLAKAQLVGIVPTSFGALAAPFAQEDSAEVWTDCAAACVIPSDEWNFCIDFAREALRRDIELALQGIISFDDQIYCPTLLGGHWPLYPEVLVDESQDLSWLNHQMLGLCLRERLIAVGDPLQCHPPGTQVLLSGGDYRNIEDLEEGDRVVSYNKKVGISGLNTQGVQIKNKAVFQFKGNLIRIQTDELYAHECTPEHRCMVRWSERQGYSVYLMRRGNHYRIGTAQNFYSFEKKEISGAFGPSMRARQEGADDLWILDTFETKEQALIKEKVIWTLFGLPDLIFKCSGTLSSTQNHLDAAWREIGDNSERAAKCLEYFGRKMQFPIWAKENNIHIGTEKTFITQACNIISGSMSVMTIDKGWSKCWISYVPYDGPVIGIEVASNGYGLNLYLANGIVTHNSIYAFRGADSNSMQNLRQLRETWIELPLTMTFRCPKVVVARQQEHARGFRAGSSNKEGLFLQAARLEEGAEAPGGWTLDWLRRQDPSGRGEITVLCRNNGPLLSLAFKLLRKGVGVKMLGRDIGKGLIGLSKKICPTDEMTKEAAREGIEGWREKELTLALANQREALVDSIQDRAECLLAVLESAEARDAGQLRQLLEQLFARDAGLITLSSIHRSKGLEWPSVVHLDPWKIPSKWARKAAEVGDRSQLRQEHNLRYVAETRTKEVLINANLQDFRP